MLPSYIIYWYLPMSLIYVHQQLPTTQISVTCLYCCWGHWGYIYYINGGGIGYIRKRGVGFKATQSSLGVSEDSKDIKDPKRSGKSQVKVYLELNL